MQARQASLWLWDARPNGVTLCMLYQENDAVVLGILHFGITKGQHVPQFRNHEPHAVCASCVMANQATKRFVMYMGEFQRITRLPCKTHKLEAFSTIASSRHLNSCHVSFSLRLFGDVWFFKGPPLPPKWWCSFKPITQGYYQAKTNPFGTSGEPAKNLICGNQVL